MKLSIELTRSKTSVLDLLAGGSFMRRTLASRLLILATSAANAISAGTKELSAATSAVAAALRSFVIALLVRLFLVDLDLPLEVLVSVDAVLELKS
jgi:hypothetical protein